MRIRKALLWQPGAKARKGIVAAMVALALGVGYLHTLAGLAYEFHVLFVFPVVITAWYVGARAGMGWRYWPPHSGMLKIVCWGESRPIHFR